MITVTLTLGLNGKAQHVAADFDREDFQLGRDHILANCLSPLCEQMFVLYRAQGGTDGLIDFEVELAVDGRAKQIRPARITKGDFTTGFDHVLATYFAPMAEIIEHAYGQLAYEVMPGVREALEEREGIRRRLAAIGMV